MTRKLMFAAALAVLFVGGISTGAGGSPTSITKICSTVTRTVTSTVTNISTVISTVMQTVTVTSSTTTTTATTTTTTTTIPTTTQQQNGCTTSISSGLQAAIQNAAGGSTICLSSGSYGAVTLSSIAKAADVTVQPAAGATVTLGSFTLNAVTHLHVTGLGGSVTIAGTNVDSSSGCSHNVTFDNLTYTGSLNVYPRWACSSSLAITFDHDRFDNLSPGAFEGRINVQGMAGAGGTPPNSPNGVTISNSHIGGYGPIGQNNCSDGIDILGDAYGTLIAGDEFVGIDQNPGPGCTAHVDPIQIYGGSHSVITGSYFHDMASGSGGVAAGQDADYTTFTNNVFVCSCIYPWSIEGNGSHDDVIQHNTFAGGGEVRFARHTSNTGAVTIPYNNLVRDNVFTSGGGMSTDGSNWGTADHNLNVGVSGTGNINGTPVFVGGGGWAGYALAPSSPGYNAASDGKPMGICDTCG